MKAIKQENKLHFIIDKEYLDLVDKLKDSEMINIEVLTPSRYRTNQHNRYMWGVVYKSFVPSHFQETKQVHDYFADYFLKQTDIIELDSQDFINFINDIKSDASKVLSYRKINGKIEVIWIKSTTSLTSKELTEYINQIKLFGNELGIEFENFDINKNYGV
jgi:hypothetical protein